jgi:polysaccharide biosynthesis protein PelA
MKLPRFLMLLAGLLPFHAVAAPTSTYAIYYSDKEPAAAFEAYDLVVFDSDRYPPIATLKEKGKTVLGYISLGEVEKHRSYFNEVKKAGLLIEKNEVWTDAYKVDVRNPAWTKMVVEELIPQILAKGFDGVFLDTVDNPPDLERRDPRRFHGMSDAMAQMVKAIKHHHPKALIMQNRGYDILPEVAPYIDMVLGECVYTNYNFDKKTYGYVASDLYQQQVKILKDAQKVSPKLKVYTLDYWKEDDSKTITQIYKTQRENGFIPYVATISLDKIVHEPGKK